MTSRLDPDSLHYKAITAPVERAAAQFIHTHLAWKANRLAEAVRDGRLTEQQAAALLDDERQLMADLAAEDRTEMEFDE